MATFDQLPAEQRAILELVLQRRQSYADLADMLGMPAARVRELAREALTDLAPHSAQSLAASERFRCPRVAVPSGPVCWPSR